MVEFAYAVGRIRALEVHLLNESSIIRMVDARNFEAAFLALRENPHYAEKIDRLSHPFDFENMIQDELRWVKELLDDLAPANEILSSIWKKFEPGATLDACLEELRKTAEKHPVPIFVSYARAFTLLSRLRRSLLEGKIDPDSALNRFRYTDYSRAVAAGMEYYKKHGSLSVLEREIDNRLTEIVKMARYKAFGIEPLIGFAVAKDIEVKIIRLILVSKRMHIKTEDIKERLRLPYA